MRTKTLYIGLQQASFKRQDTVICHFCKRLKVKPFPHTENFKQWQIEGIHKELKCYRFDDDLNEYLKLKKEYEEIVEENKKIEIK